VWAKNAIQMKDFREAQVQISQVPQSASEYLEASALHERALKESRRQEAVDAARVGKFLRTV